MPREDVRRERRAVLLLGLLVVAFLAVGVLAAVVFTAGEPRRGEGMIPPPADEPQQLPDQIEEGDQGPADG